MPLKQDIFCFDPSQNIRNYLNTFMIRNEFAMKIEFNDILKRIVTSGLISKWRNNLQLYSLSIKRIAEEESMNIINFSYIFILQLQALIASILIFLLELLIFRKANSTNSTKFWIFCDKVICGKRCFFLPKRKNKGVIILFTK